MSKLQDIRELAQEHATLVSSSPRDWMGYMDTAARLYRYPFTDQLLIHAQHPQATACASLELWNEKMFRWVNRELGESPCLTRMVIIPDSGMCLIFQIRTWWQAEEALTCGRCRNISRKRSLPIWQKRMVWKKKIQGLYRMR